MLLELRKDIEFGFSDRKVEKQDYQKLLGNETVKEFIDVISLYNRFVAKNTRVLNIKDIYYLGSLISNFKGKHKKNFETEMEIARRNVQAITLVQCEYKK